MDPQDCKREIPPALPERPKSVLKIRPPERPKSSASKVSVKSVNGALKPCLNINQRRVVKYNLLLSIAINVLVMALGGTGFVSIVSGEHNENSKRYKYGKCCFLFNVMDISLIRMPITENPLASGKIECDFITKEK